ncbi:hypothetical protein A2276_01595 [candidate division WOR-1 bacterium RIFOXYA12_FULL_43_27]|uniref:Bulb-type lectin domain-containing protein n=1 Tax=candidate division WOR-1 bacterium RIFOXYC2_FULL_46_14 TaxID=1802587 RepID=A0A1F4U6Q0_UNCSA|nr:MAG: hypothetical protein A2276_01595 [candidate division WOR-1 bacterium RIFOXYA12_FULL_43_27]OGC19580.1 MAG: hypothetical protein A2292_02735 [candidate division WOR-1 bacterium RIFOXYB2_FULL_46_45]OGC30569.1 MAG: hypothetical protein A2232_02735 [candidate division WOR-1 bacterium RIFOXYA2_FULL_46_56]OGC40636.1 MAG: hypothetical protein A2438_06450 [candidate division WOR-1 bacterium RIFOXYC2_FULL_46_14]
MRFFFPLPLTLFLTLLLTFPSHALPSPLTAAVSVCPSFGKIEQRNPLIIGGLVVFEDSRSGKSKLYAQKIGADNDTPVSGSRGSQSGAKMVWSEDNAAIVVWQEEENGITRILAQKIGPDGSPLWGSTGIMLANSEKSQSDPVLVSDRTGGAIVAWQDFRKDNEDIYAQRIGINGNLLWQKEGVALTAHIKTQWYPQIAEDGSGGAIIAWSDRRDGNFDIYVQRVTANGGQLWGTEGKKIAGSELNEEDPRLINLKNNRTALSYRIKTNGSYLFLLDENGNVSFSTQINQTCPEIELAAGSGNEIIAFYSDAASGDTDLYCKAFNEKGQLLWNQPIAEVRGAEEQIKIKGTGPWIAAWVDHRNGRAEIFSQKIESGGTLSFGANGMKISEKQQDPLSYSFYANENGEGFFAFQNDSDIYGRKIGGGEEPFIINSAKGRAAQKNARLIDDNSGNYIAAFEDYRRGYSEIYLTKISPQGTPLWGKAGIAVSPNGSPQKNPQIAGDGAGGAWVVWEDGSKLFCQRINRKGERISKSGIVLTPTIGYAEQTRAQIVSDHNHGTVIVWENYESAYNAKDIWAQRITSKGKLAWKNGVKIIAYGGDQAAPAISDKNLVVAWADSRLDGRTFDIYAQKINSAGELLWAEDGIPVCEAPDVQIDPVIADSGDDSIVFWTDKAGGSFDIYAQKVDANGTCRWVKDGIAVAQSSRTQQRAKISLPTVLWEDFRFGNWDIYAQALGSDGKLLWADDGIPIVSASATQYNPQIVKNIVAWEDFRNESNYAIYLQKLGSDGKNLYPANGVLVEASALGGRFPALAAASNLSSFAVMWEDVSLGEPRLLWQRFRP